MLRPSTLLHPARCNIRPPAHKNALAGVICLQDCTASTLAPCKVNRGKQQGAWYPHTQLQIAATRICHLYSIPSTQQAHAMNCWMNATLRIVIISACCEVLAFLTLKGRLTFPLFTPLGH
eukprot:1162032-Pelagomonas_calceolata.AAC.3